MGLNLALAAPLVKALPDSPLRLRSTIQRTAPPMKMPRVPSGRLLDVGCSSGHFLKVALDHGYDIHGVEPNPEMAKFATESLKLPKIQCGTLHAAHYPDASFDAVTLWDVLEHVEDPGGILEEVRRVLRPGGWLVGSDWIRTVDECDGEHGAAIRAVEQAWRLSSLATIGEWQGALKGVGFEIVGLEDFAARVHRNAELLAHSLSDLQLEAAQPDEGTGSLALWIDQCATLLQAWTIGAFSIARFCALRP